MLPAIALSLALLAAQTDAGSGQSAQQPPTAATDPSLLVKPPCRNPDASGKYHIGCGVTAPVTIHSVEPKYPQDAIARKLPTGGLTVTLTVDTNGNPTDVHMRDSRVDKVDKSARSVQQLLEDSMVDAVRQYKFKPATLQGKPVPVELNIEFSVDYF